MKKLLLTIIFLGTVSLLRAQTLAGTSTLPEQAAGYQLRLASRHFYTGVVFAGAGVIFDVVGLISQPQNNSLITIGGLSYLTGFIFIIESYSHIGKAGKILMGNTKFGLGPTRSGGVGLSYNF